MSASVTHHEILMKVEKPGRYTGGEWNACRKDPAQMDVRMALAFPDVYEVGMSHLGLKILYEIANGLPWAFAERVFAPWVDMEKALRDNEHPLFALESGDPITRFDVVGFTLQYELSYTNILNMLDLAAIPLRSADRGDEDPLIIAGGPCAFNPEPLAPFLDAVVLGEGEEVLVEILEAVRGFKRQGLGRQECLRALSRIRGVYVPALYRVTYHPDGTIRSVDPEDMGIPGAITKRVVESLDAAPFPTCPVVPFLDVIQDRVALEIHRGCTRGCRFCQAGMIYRPVRERAKEKVLSLLDQNIRTTGHAEVSLVSLSSSDHSQIAEMADESIRRHGASGVTVTLPSLRADSFSVDLAQRMEPGRKTGLTFAPEAATQRLRNVINKGLREEDLLTAISHAAKAGWTRFKLYFMIGLPTETEEDLTAMAELSRRALDQVRRAAPGARDHSVAVSVSTFVPKAHTPFQWRAQDGLEDIRAKQDLLKRIIRGRGLTFQWHDPEASRLEAVLARGDRRMGDVIETAWHRGSRFDGWSEHFQPANWSAAFADHGLDPASYANRARPYEEILPWDHLVSGVNREFLAAEDRKAAQEALTADCREQPCADCGVCPALRVRPRKAVADGE